MIKPLFKYGAAILCGFIAGSIVTGYALNAVLQKEKADLRASLMNPANEQPAKAETVPNKPRVVVVDPSLAEGLRNAKEIVRTHAPIRENLLFLSEDFRHQLDELVELSHGKFSCELMEPKDYRDRLVLKTNLPRDETKNQHDIHIKLAPNCSSCVLYVWTSLQSNGDYVEGAENTLEAVAAAAVAAGFIDPKKLEFFSPSEATAKGILGAKTNPSVFKK